MSEIHPNDMKPKVEIDKWAGLHALQATLEAFVLAHIGCCLSEGFSWEPDWATPIINDYMESTGGYDAWVARYLAPREGES